MTNTVPTGAHDPARPPVRHDGLEALLRILPHRHKPGVWALLSGLGLNGPNWSQIDVPEDWVAFALAFMGMGPLRPSQIS